MGNYEGDTYQKIVIQSCWTMMNYASPNRLFSDLGYFQHVRPGDRGRARG